MVFYLSILSFTSDRLSPGLVAYTSAYPIICKKSWQRGAQPQLITTFINNSLHMFCPDLSVSNLILQIDTPPWYVNVGRHPRIRLAMACVSKGWEECQL